METGDPSDVWAHQDEDFVGLIGAIAHSRGGARNAATIPGLVVKKYKALSV